MKPRWKVTFVHTPLVGESVTEVFDLRSKNGVTAIRLAKKRSKHMPSYLTIASAEPVICESLEESEVK